MPKLTIEVTDEDLEILTRELRNAKGKGRNVASVEDLAAIAVEVLCTGLRRPGSWESGTANSIASEWRGWKP